MLINTLHENVKANLFLGVKKGRSQGAHVNLFFYIKKYQI